MLPATGVTVLLQNSGGTAGGGVLLVVWLAVVLATVAGM